jgi:hypothetical protein
MRKRRELGPPQADEDSFFHHDTGPGRCFPFWQEMLACYVVNTNSEDGSGKKKCAPMLEDYYECLHHRKEVLSALSITQPPRLVLTQTSTTGCSCPRSPIRIPQAPCRKPQRRRPLGRSNKESGLDRRRPPRKGHEGRCPASSRQDKLKLFKLLYHRNYFSLLFMLFSCC